MNNNVRTFRAADPRSALDAVKAAMGPDAIIIGTREIGGLWGRTEIEITASREAPAPAAPPPDAGVQSELSSLRRLVEQLRPPATGRERARAPAPRAAETSDGAAVERRLVLRGVEPGTAERLVRDALDERARGEDLEASLRKLLGRQLLPGPAPWQGGGRRVIALVGPTGVGKTTTIAKIAARALLESKLRVALITIDSYRIGAREHLARYGELMHVPTHVARDRESLVAALGKCDEADLVLVDTAGRSDREAIAAQGALLRSVSGIELHLALSAAVGARELRAAARRFAELAPSRLIFTKLDEADGPASILAAASTIPRPVSCIANGQRVPDDLHVATASSLIEIVMGPSSRS